VSATPIGQGQLASTVAVTVTFAHQAPGVPERFVAKFPAQNADSRAFAQGLGCYLREVSFYREAASKLSVRTPVCYVAEVSPDGADFLLLLEDLSPALECGQLDGCDPARAATALSEAAALHASSWGDEHLGSADWLRSGVGVWRHVTTNAPLAAHAFLDRFAGRLDEATQRVVGALDRGPAAAWAERALRPRCVWHCDFPLDNLLFDGKNGQVPLAVVDWQSVTWADGTIDASYFLGASLPTEIRREYETDLVRGYHRALAEGGVTDYSWDDCWEDYRVNTIAGLLVAITAAVGTAPSPEADALFTTMASRHAHHMIDHDTLAWLAP
jgi:hypothetical protein